MASDTQRAPRAKAGGRYHQYGGESYAVVLGADGAEVSDRHPGHLWIAVSPGRNRVDVDLLFIDDQGSSSSTFVTTRSSPTLRVCLFADGDKVAEVYTASGYYAKGCSLAVDWSSMFSRMA